LKAGLITGCFLQATPMTEATLSLADFDERTPSDIPYKVAYPKPDGTTSPLILHILGDQSPRVQSEQNTLINERRKLEAAVEAQKASGALADTYTPVEPIIEFGQRLAAVRLVGWDGVKEPYSKEAALNLIKSSERLAKFVSTESGRIGNFIKSSPAT
jgi:hypothetical protein